MSGKRLGIRDRRMQVLGIKFDWQVVLRLFANTGFVSTPATQGWYQATAPPAMVTEKCSRKSVSRQGHRWAAQVKSAKRSNNKQRRRGQGDPATGDGGSRMRGEKNRIEESRDKQSWLSTFIGSGRS